MYNKNYWKKVATNLKENAKIFMGEFGQIKGKEYMLQLNYNKIHNKANINRRKDRITFFPVPVFM